MAEGVTIGGSRRQLLLLAGAGACLCALLVAGYFYFLRTPYQSLFTKLRPSDAATIVAELDKKKVPYKLEDGGQTILVPADIADSTRLGVVSQDLPLKGMVGFELFNKSDMGVTEFAQKINYQRALQGELARTIMTLDSVDTARIHLSLPEETIFRDDKKPAKASVTIQARPGRKVTAPTVRGIQKLVAAGVPDLDPLQVVVLDAGGSVLSGDMDLAPSGAPVSPAKRSAEQYYEDQVRQAIARTLPEGDADIRVWAGPATTPNSASAALQMEEKFKAWTPDSRDFRLFVAITASRPLSSRAITEVEGLAGAAVGLNAALGDAVHVTIAQGAQDQSGAPETEIAPRVLPAPEAAQPARGWLGGWEYLLALALLVALVVAYRRRQPEPPTLTEEQRSDYVSRFKTLLEKGEVDAPKV